MEGTAPRLILAVSVAALLTFGCSGDRPAVIWSPAPVTQRVEPNGFRLISLRFQSAEQVSVANDGLTAEFKIRVRIDPHRTETTILLHRSAEDQIWCVARF